MRCKPLGKCIWRGRNSQHCAPILRWMPAHAQRSAALERAGRAELSSFEALAETTRMARERDAAHARIAELEIELHALHKL